MWFTQENIKCSFFSDVPLTHATLEAWSMFHSYTKLQTTYNNTIDCLGYDNRRWNDACPNVFEKLAPLSDADDDDVYGDARRALAAYSQARARRLHLPPSAAPSPVHSVMSHPHPPQIVLRGAVRVDNNGIVEEVEDHELLFDTNIVPLFTKGEGAVGVKEYTGEYTSILDKPDDEAQQPVLLRSP